MSVKTAPTHRAHKGTSWDAGAVYPAGGDSLGLPAVYIGQDANSGGAFAFDEFLAYNPPGGRQRIISSPNMAVFGTVGFWKSSLSKTLIYRQIGCFGENRYNDNGDLVHLGRQSWVLDPKGEYGKLAAKLGCPSIALKPGGDLRLNPLDPVGGWEVQASLLSAVTSAALGRKLFPVEEAGAREALSYVTEWARNGQSHGQPTIPDVADVMLRPPPQVVDALGYTGPDKTTHATGALRDAALALSRLVSGDLRGMFDGPTSAGLETGGRMVHLDLSAVYDSSAIGILMTCAAAWMRAQLDAARASGQQRLIHMVFDEAWRPMATPGCAEWLQESTKLSRSLGRAVRLLMHRVSDTEAVGDAGTRITQLATGLLAECETVVLYRQPAQELDRVQQMVGLTNTERATVEKLPPGVALWKVGGRSFMVAHRRSQVEATFTDTDAAMGGAA